MLLGSFEYVFPDMMNEVIERYSMIQSNTKAQWAISQSYVIYTFWNTVNIESEPS